jgi:hypothetical protein
MMKKSLNILLIFMIFASVLSCKKDKDENGSTEGVSGTWTGTAYVSDTPFGFEMTLHQSGTDITGNFMSDDESVYGTFTGESTIDGSDIDLYFTEVYDQMTMNFHFIGTVNEALTSMEGEYYANDIDIGSWSADKSAKKAAINPEQGAEGKLIDQIINELK